MLSGGIRHWIPKSTNDKGETYKQLEELTQAQCALSRNVRMIATSLRKPLERGIRSHLTKT